MPPTEFEPTIPASEQLQTHVLDRAATRIGFVMTLYLNVIIYLMKEQCVFCEVGTKYKHIIQLNITTWKTDIHYLLNLVHCKGGLTPHMQVVLY
jgi:hypothetical protein